VHLGWLSRRKRRERATEPTLSRQAETDEGRRVGWGESKSAGAETVGRTRSSERDDFMPLNFN
jgi:hypothetical protein